MSTITSAQSLPSIGRVSGPGSPTPTRRRARAPHGLLLQRALDLRDEMPSGRRRADIPRRRSYVQIAVGATATTSGITTLLLVNPMWNWLGAFGAGLGPAVLMLGVTDVLNTGDDRVRRVARLFRVVRIGALFLNTLLVVMELAAALAAVGLLGAAMLQGPWSQTVESLLASALVVATMAFGLTLLVRVAELPVVPLGRDRWWRELWTLRQVTNVAIAVTLVGAAVAFSLRDARGVAIAMVGLTTVLLGWAMADRTATDEAVRRLAEAADAVAAAFRPLVASSPCQYAVAGSEHLHHDAISALDALELAGYRHMRRGFVPSAPRYLVDAELLAVIRACKVALAAQSLEHVTAPLTTTVARALLRMKRPELEREILVFAADVRRLATLAPDRLEIS